MNREAHDHAADIAALLADPKVAGAVRYLDLQRAESASQALARWPLLRRIDAALRAASPPEAAA